MWMLLKVVRACHNIHDCGCGDADIDSFKGSLSSVSINLKFRWIVVLRCLLSDFHEALNYSCVIEYNESVWGLLGAMFANSMTNIIVDNTSQYWPFSIYIGVSIIIAPHWKFIPAVFTCVYVSTEALCVARVIATRPWVTDGKFASWVTKTP